MVTANDIKHTERDRQFKEVLKGHVIYSQCLKILKKVSFNIASEAGYVYILRGQKFIRNAKNGQF